MLYLPIRKLAQGVLVNGEVNERKPKGNQLPAAFGPGVRCARLESLVRYPKPVDLCLGRLKPLEREVEGRTDTDVQIVRMTWV